MNLISIRDLEEPDLLKLTEGTIPGQPALQDVQPIGLRGTLALLFQQPSLRTMSSFASAGTRIGLAPITITTGGNKFRDLVEFEDEIHQLSLISQCVVVRSAVALRPEDHRLSPVPVINAGDGSNEHPTQTLVDLTVMRSFGLDGRTVAIMGNLRDHRTAHSLTVALERLGVKVRLVSPEELAMGQPYRGEAAEVVHAETERDRDAALADADFVYLLPVLSLEASERLLQDLYRIDLPMAERVLKPTAKILHPFARFGELDKSVDYTRYDAYHLQTSLGAPVRERLLRHLLDLGAARVPVPLRTAPGAGLQRLAG